MEHKRIHMLARSLFLALAIFLPSCIASAEETKEQKAEETMTETLSVSSKYSEGIESQDGDIFTIEFSNTDTGDASTIEVDASDITEAYQEYVLPTGSYEVTNIIYSGSNDTIIEEGYGTENTFRLKEGEGDLLHIYIGETEVASLQSDYSQAVIKDDEHDENGKRTVFEDRSGKYRYVEDDSGNSVIEYLDEGEENTDSRQYSEDSGEPSEESTGQDTAQEGSQEPVTEYYEVSNTEDEGIVPMLIMIGAGAVIALAGIGIIYLLRKKGFF